MGWISNSGMLSGHASQAEARVIEFRDVSYRVDRTQVICGLNLQVARGETLVLLGRSGSGKTTTLKLINRLVSPSAEKSWSMERPIDRDVIRLRRGIGYVIQDVGLFPHFTVERNIAICSEDRRLARRSDSGSCGRAFATGGLGADLADTLSAPAVRRTAAAGGRGAGLAADPAILLMDEPFGALDPLTRDELQREFLSLQQRLHKTVVFVTHDLREALRLGTRIALMEAGRLVTVLSPHEFLKSPDPWASAYVRAFGDGLESAADRGTS